LLDKPGEDPQPFTLSADKAVALFRDAVEQAKKAGLPWMETELVLTPSPQLAELVRRSQELAASSAEAGEGGG
jgi:CRISPR-associated protein Csb1